MYTWNFDLIVGQLKLYMANKSSKVTLIMVSIVSLSPPIKLHLPWVSLLCAHPSLAGIIDLDTLVKLFSDAWSLRFSFQFLQINYLRFGNHVNQAKVIDFIFLPLMFHESNSLNWCTQMFGVHLLYFQSMETIALFCLLMISIKKFGFNLFQLNHKYCKPL